MEEVVQKPSGGDCEIITAYLDGFFEELDRP